MLGPLSAVVRLIVQRLGLLVASGDERDAEILALRHQVLVLQHQVSRPRFTETDRTILAILSHALDRSRLAALLRWARAALAGEDESMKCH